MNDHIANIIAKRFRNAATAGELAELQLWVEADAANRQEYDQLVQIWEQSAHVLQDPSFDATAAWSKLDTAIQQSTPQRRIIPINTWKWAVAVVVLVLAGAAWFFWQQKDAQWQSITANVAHQPIDLPDGSTVLLRKGSTLQYPAAFTGRQRRVRLSGEAFFQVQRNEQHPFRISTAHSDIEVLGTSFLVHSTKQADEIVVKTGKVSVTDNDRSGNKVILTAGQKAVLANTRFQQSAVADSNYIAWKTGLLDFNGTPLLQVLEEIAHYYDITVAVPEDQHTAVEEIRITARFQNQPAEQVLEEIRLTSGLEMRKERDTIVFFKK